MLRKDSATGLQIAILIFAVVFLGAPADKYLGALLGLDSGFDIVRGRLFFFIPAALLLMLVPELRRRCLRDLRSPIPKERELEVAAVALAHILTATAAIGAVILFHWVMGGEYALARRLGMQQAPQAAWVFALSVPGIIFQVVVASTLAPVVEELVFRGFLYRAWEAQWGWVWSMLATSTVFALYHPNFVSAFFGSVLMVCILRRTGSLRACILAHATYNTLLWYPLLGQFMFRTAGRETGELAPWTLHLVVLGLVLAALMIYVWMSRDAKVAPTVKGEALGSARA